MRALVAASKDVAPIRLFFSTLNSIINLITASPKRHGELQSTQEIDIAHMVDTGERETVVETLIKDEASNSIRGEATAFNQMKLSMFPISSRETSVPKEALKKLRLEGWDTFFEEVESFCKKHDIDMPDMNAPYKVGTRRSCQQRDDITIEHHYQVDLFNDK
ncbi:hypothetical protein L3X38_031800 [Prunus dulcis]|uniref:Uncharacterized protein n=1 Tax=Prunus dulcis TaxID=3755 RepID=A0AAD4VD80_PRUDU|nr:hypothetical protein L3X38_031800 [Prunus dulcis]